MTETILTDRTAHPVTPSPVASAFRPRPPEPVITI